MKIYAYFEVKNQIRSLGQLLWGVVWLISLKQQSLIFMDSQRYLKIFPHVLLLYICLFDPTIWPDPEKLWSSSLRNSEEQGSLACCSPWGCKEQRTTQRLKNKYFLHELINKFQEEKPWSLNQHGLEKELHGRESDER